MYREQTYERVLDTSNKYLSIDQSIEEVSLLNRVHLLYIDVSTPKKNLESSTTG